VVRSVYSWCCLLLVLCCLGRQEETVEKRVQVNEGKECRNVDKRVRRASQKRKTINAAIARARKPERIIQSRATHVHGQIGTKGAKKPNQALCNDMKKNNGIEGRIEHGCGC